MKNSKKISIIMFLLCFIFISGCGISKENIEETLSSIEITDKESVIEYTPKEYTIPKTMEELYSLSLEEFKKMIEENIPDYYSFFKIDENHVLTNDNWEDLRDIFSLHLFKERKIEKEELEQNIITKNQDENAIYYAPTYSYIESLDNNGFIQYLNGLYKYVYPNAEQVDFTQLTEDEVIKLKEEMLDSLSE